MSGELKEAIRQLAGTAVEESVYTVLAEVVTVDLDARTCTCQTIGGKTAAEMKTVSLMAEVSDGYLMEPEIGSTVIIAWSSRMLPYVVMFSDIKNIYLDASSKIIMNQGTYGGLVKVQDLVIRLNNIENAFNLLNAKVNALAPTPVIPNLTLTVRGNIENTNVTHG